MKLKFDSSQQFQLDAVASIIVFISDNLSKSLLFRSKNEKIMKSSEIKLVISQNICIFVSTYLPSLCPGNRLCSNGQVFLFKP
jgi:pantothenate kinase-related protein Tda10